MGSYYLGVDLGGSKSQALVADENGQALGLGTGGSGNHETVGYEQMTRVMLDITGQALAGAGIKIDDLGGAGLGIAGYDWESELADMQAATKPLGLSCPLELVNDALIGLAAGAESGWGVAVVSGTGCNCWGWDDQHRVGHVTGAGSLMAEGAGAIELTARAVQAVSRAWSRRGKPTAITQELIDLFGACDMDDLVEGLCTYRYFVEPSFAPRIFKLAEEGDEVAGDLIRWAGEQLGSLALGVIHQLKIAHQAFEVILVGRMFDGGRRLIDPLRRVVLAVAPRAKFVRLEAPPVVGGVLLGMKKAGTWRVENRRRLIDGALALLDK
ncbi:MAG: hypothetical protein JW704_06045 [Anaerolineaceae bacterium]|nr:hypothetical protein [Anaerolineaceae bacterium]MBN2676707.1 hypothetical protein [Anaerolineaceae bacterium]